MSPQACLDLATEPPVHANQAARSTRSDRVSRDVPVCYDSEGTMVPVRRAAPLTLGLLALTVAAMVL
jgi:hypothetical protein